MDLKRKATALTDEQSRQLWAGLEANATTINAAATPANSLIGSRLCYGGGTCVALMKV